MTSQNTCAGPIVLAVDDEVDICAIYQELMGSMCRVLVAHDGLSAVEMVKAHRPEVIILDLNMPDKDGIWVCEQLDRLNMMMDTSVYVASAQSEIESKEHLYALGVQDFIEKPFNGRELKAKIRGCFMRMQSRRTSTIQLGNLQYDRSRKSAVLGDVDIHFTNIEAKILESLLQESGKVVDTTRLNQQVWPNVAVTGGALHVHICSLRRKLSGFDHEIKNIHGNGYMLLKRDEAPKAIGQ